MRTGIRLLAFAACSAALLFAAFPKPCDAAAEAQLLKVDLLSSVLTRFAGKPVYIHAEILLPDDYYKQPGRRFPEIFWIPAFEGTEKLDMSTELRWQRPMRSLHSEFILVLLDGMIASGHHEFADSANNGPWGQALTTEFIPLTDAHFRTIGTAPTRFVVGHSSGGWSALWLQVNYPDVFGGCWAISPDPVDFRDFTGPNLTLDPPQNFYTDSHGNDYTIERYGNHDSMTLRELVSGSSYGIWQFNSFEAVFSPRQANGKPQPLFDRANGKIDPAVARYWEDHYDIDTLLREEWVDLAPKLRGKLHVFVGSEDTFHLDRPVRFMQAELQGLGSDAEIVFVPGADHWSVFDYKGGLTAYIIAEMTARLAETNPGGRSGDESF